MRTIRAKFECSHIEKAPEGYDYDGTAYLTAVYANKDGSVNEENKSFSEATPSGNLQITISKNVPASKFFQPNREYYLDFTKIPQDQE
tara:strand:+ start:9908 stop:10171 length:264 start_codon:yes stop_codon:yes gene_type:complete